ncbi:unnamed protein product [Spirodela intermedia]|uniref:Integrase zinc-binding domain-containing protein n=1 Tax=Spirodela intermedia TaxID=51605 RepID=A0A7I8JYC9_SPIIN|nr:unnamed protein product [Spirodela intermedia]CAA7388793.1 unnamed protein product [Spirodela intermedia]
MHCRWISFIQKFSFLIKHKSRKSDKVADALSRKSAFLITMREVSGFEYLTEHYAGDEDFAEIWYMCKQGKSFKAFHILEDHLFRENQLCIPRTSLREKLIRELHAGGFGGHLSQNQLRIPRTLSREKLIRELHAGGLGGHLGCDKTLKMMDERYYWPQLKKEAESFHECVQWNFNLVVKLVKNKMISVISHKKIYLMIQEAQK